MKRRPLALTLSAVTLPLFLARVAAAEPRSAAPAYRTAGESATYEVTFTDDDLLSAPESAYGEWLKIRGTAPRAGLLRPRTTFVPELLKSVQGLAW